MRLRLHIVPIVAATASISGELAQIARVFVEFPAEELETDPVPSLSGRMARWPDDLSCAPP